MVVVAAAAAAVVVVVVAVAAVHWIPIVYSILTTQINQRYRLTQSPSNVLNIS